MSKSSFGESFIVTTFGESHGEALGVVIDGVPSNFKIDMEELQRYLDRRKPSSLNYSTSRKESDIPHFLSGIKNGITLGTPIAIIFYNENAVSKDYESLKDVFRPGHADATYEMKYGIRDYCGGGRSSGRETISRVAAGGIATQLLSSKGIRITSKILEIGGLPTDDGTLTPSINKLIDDVKTNGDSIGGIIEVKIQGVPGGIGEPVFDKLDAMLSHAIMSIGAVKGIEFGAGFESARMKGTEMNDSILAYNQTSITTTNNNSGGILGGISTGEDIVFRVAIKPTPSISSSQKTVNNLGEPIEISINGRHDVCIVPRIQVVLEAMSAITIINMIH